MSVKSMWSRTWSTISLVSSGFSSLIHLPWRKGVKLENNSPIKFAPGNFFVYLCSRHVWLNMSKRSLIFHFMSVASQNFSCHVIKLWNLYFRSQNPASAKNQKKVLNQTQTRVREHVQYESTPQHFENHLHDLENCYGIFLNLFTSWNSLQVPNLFYFIWEFILSVSSIKFLWIDKDWNLMSFQWVFKFFSFFFFFNCVLLWF